MPNLSQQTLGSGCLAHKKHKRHTRRSSNFKQRDGCSRAPKVVYLLCFLWHVLRMEIKRINTPNAPQPAGHYSQATVYNGFVFVAGQLGIDPSNSEKKLGSIEEQTEQAL